MFNKHISEKLLIDYCLDDRKVLTEKEKNHLSSCDICQKQLREIQSIYDAGRNISPQTIPDRIKNSFVEQCMEKIEKQDKISLKGRSIQKISYSVFNQKRLKPALAIASIFIVLLISIFSIEYYQNTNKTQETTIVLNNASAEEETNQDFYTQYFNEVLYEDETLSLPYLETYGYWENDTTMENQGEDILPQDNI